MSFWCRCLHLRKDLLDLKVSATFSMASTYQNTCTVCGRCSHSYTTRQSILRGWGSKTLSRQYLHVSLARSNNKLTDELYCMRVTCKNVVVTTCSVCSSEYKCSKYFKLSHTCTTVMSQAVALQHVSSWTFSLTGFVYCYIN